MRFSNMSSIASYDSQTLASKIIQNPLLFICLLGPRCWKNRNEFGNCT